MFVRPAKRLRRAVVFGLALAFGLSAPSAGDRGVARAEDAKKIVADLHASETKTLLPILRAAMKADLRRQAWYVATRILAASPGDAEADAALRKWAPTDLQDGEIPLKSFVEKRDAAFRRVGDEYWSAGQALLSAKAKDTETWPLLERGYAYGSRNGDFVASIQQNGQVWCGTWGTQDQKLLDALGAAKAQLEFPPEWDDGYLRVRCAWPDAKILKIGTTRLVVGLGAAEAMRWAATLSALEASFLATFGSRTKPERDPEVEARRHPTIVVVPDAAAYDRLVEPLFVNRWVELKDVAGTSRYFSRGTRIGLAIAGVRDNPWVRADANVLGLAVAELARHHLAVTGGGRLEGPGGWVLLEGLSGVYEGFVPKGALDGAVDPEKVWKMAVAKAAKGEGRLMPWAEFVEFSSLKREEEAKSDLKVTVGGAPKDAKGVSVSAAQATALVWSLVRRDAEKKSRKLADLLEDAFKRDRMPDLDKLLAAKPGSLFKAADDAIDGWPPAK